MKSTILLVEDDLKICEVVQDYFQGSSRGDYCVTVVSHGDFALELLYENEYDLILLDIMLPGINGFDLCREIRKKSITPIIFITAKGCEEDKLYGYSLGCDDYIVKPFSLSELYAKVTAMIKRSKGLIGGEQIVIGNISIDPVCYRVVVKDDEINLAPKEFALLKYLAEHKGMIVTRDELLIRIWGYDYEGNDRIVDNHIKKLRKCLGEEGKRIKTVFTKGYRLEENESGK